MRQTLTCLLLIGAVWVVGACVPAKTAQAKNMAPPLPFEAAPWAPLSASRQLILVLAPGWDSPQGVMFRYERRDIRTDWRVVGRSDQADQGAPGIQVSLGGSGLAWGRGIHGDVPEDILAPPDSRTDAPIKREGDGRSPAGVFRLGPAFGDKRLGLAMPQLVTTPDLRCVDDPNSRAYNMIIDVRDGEMDWSTAEAMQRSDGQYSLGVVVGHNDGVPLPGAGSCIFLHVRPPASSSFLAKPTTTAGCTAMDSKHLDSVARWLDPTASPVLVQLPQAEYERFKGLWGLP